MMRKSVHTHPYIHFLHVFTFLLIVGLSVLGSCTLMQKPDIVTVIGYGTPAGAGKPADSIPGTPVPEVPWRNETITIQGRVSAPDTVDSVTQRKFIARAAARRTAKRNLAKEVMLLPIGHGRTLRDFILEFEEVVPKVEEIVTKPSVTKEEEISQGTWEVSVTLSLESLASLLMRTYDKHAEIYGEERPAVILSPEERDRAREAAVRDAFTKLMNLIKDLQVDAGITVGDVLSSKPEMQTKLVTLVQDARTTDVQYPGDGSCRVGLKVNISKVRKSFDYP